MYVSKGQITFSKFFCYVPSKELSLWMCIVYFCKDISHFTLNDESVKGTKHILPCPVHFSLSLWSGHEHLSLVTEYLCIVKLVSIFMHSTNWLRSKVPNFHVGHIYFESHLAVLNEVPCSFHSLSWHYLIPPFFNTAHLQINKWLS